LISIVVIAAVSITGTAYGVTVLEADGTGGKRASVKIIHDSAPGQFRFEDDGGNVYAIRHPPSGGRIEWVDLSGTPRIDFSIQTATGNVGINKIFAAEKELNLHHKDKNPSNNKWSNIVIYCRACHNDVENTKPKNRQA